MHELVAVGLEASKMSRPNHRKCHIVYCKKPLNSTDAHAVVVDLNGGGVIEQEVGDPQSLQAGLFLGPRDLKISSAFFREAMLPWDPTVLLLRFLVSRNGDKPKRRHGIRGQDFTGVILGELLLHLQELSRCELGSETFHPGARIRCGSRGC